MYIYIIYNIYIYICVYMYLCACMRIYLFNIDNKGSRAALVSPEQNAVEKSGFLHINPWWVSRGKVNTERMCCL